MDVDSSKSIPPNKPAVLARFVAASGLANLGDGIATVAWAWTASLITRDPLMIAIVAVALRLPWAVFALPAGLLTDRMDRRKLILWMDMVRAAAFALAALGLWLSMPLPAPPPEGFGSLAAFVILTLAALTVGIAEVFRDNAAQTMLPALVPHDRLEHANGRLWSIELSGNALVGPPLGAALVGIALPLPFLSNGLTYGLAALIVAGISGNFRPAQNSKRNWRTELTEGIAFLRDAPLLRLLALVTGCWNLFFQMVMIALVLHVQENLGSSPATYGIILAAGAVGGIAGGLAAEQIVRRLGKAATAQWMLFASVPAFVGIALVKDVYSLALILALFQFSGLVWNTVSVSTRQRMIPDQLRGRVNSIYRLLAWGMMPIGLLLSGIIVRLGETMFIREIALTGPFWVAAAGILLVTLVGWRKLGVGLA